MDLRKENVRTNSGGLLASRWAGQQATKSFSPARSNTPRYLPGDWTCPKCNYMNFASRKNCNQCLTPSENPGRSAGNMEGPQKCDTINPSTHLPCNTTFSRRYDFDQHKKLIHNISLKPETVAQEVSQPILSEYSNGTTFKPRNDGGIFTSRWAPRNHAGRQRQINPKEVWIKTISINDTSNSYQSPPLSDTSDLGLPYEVQHCILTIIQRILEEGCYDFAARWMPNTLQTKNWTCSEAVELATWRQILPDETPQRAITPAGGNSLRSALRDAVQIRNAATHRHLQSNNELRRMAIQARDLMTMFADSSREGKLDRLWAELKEWETSSRIEEYAARNRLQQALQEISERPMDDMDWSPNSESLQEIIEPLQETYEDRMEID